MHRNIEALNHIFEDKMPIAKAMGIHIACYSAQKIILEAPFEKNYNLQNTIFGGSIYALAVLSGWGLLYQHFSQYKTIPNIVIHSSDIQFNKPICGILSAVSQFYDEDDYKSLQKIYDRVGKVRVTLESSINEGSALFKGNYVIYKNPLSII